MKFVDPWILLLIPAVIILAALLVFSMEKRKKSLLAQICGNREVTTLSRRKRLIKYVMMTLGMVILLFAAARPYFRIEMNTTENSSRDVLVLFDVSKSMRATDLPPNRMEQAKYLLREIFRAFPGDRFGIVPFAGKAFLSCPLTADHQALLTAVDDLDTGSVPVGGTNLSAALETAKRAFAGSGGDHRAIILLTDGDQLDGDALKSAAELKKENIPVIAVGFGSPDAAAPVPGDNGGVMHSRSGEVAGSRLDETLLQKLAAETGGIYLRSTVSDTGFAGVKNFLDKLNKASSERISRGNPVDLFGYFFAGAFICLLISAFLSDYRKTAAIFLAMMPFFILYGEAPPEAAPADPVKLYSEALDRQQSGNKDAGKLYSELIAGKDTPALLRGRSLHNLAVIRHTDARETMIKSRNALQKQNTDEALKEVDAAIKELGAGKELYGSAMEFKENSDADAMRTGNYQQLILDLKEAEKLKKELEELKKQQQQAQNQAQNAQQQNQQQQGQNQQNQQQQGQNQQQQGQNQQQQGQNQQQQGQNQQQQGQNQQNQQQQGQNQQNQQQSSASSAAKAAEKLEKQARDLGQDKLADNARDAAEKLKEADQLQKQGDKEKAGKLLDEAVEKLGKPDDKKADDKNDQEAGKQGDKSSDKESGKDKSDGKGDKPSDKKPEKDEKKSGADRVLDLLDDEAEKLRDAIRRQRNLRRAPVEKDW